MSLEVFDSCLFSLLAYLGLPHFHEEFQPTAIAVDQPQVGVDNRAGDRIRLGSLLEDARLVIEWVATYE